MVLGHTARKRLSWAGSWDLGLFRPGSDHWALRPPRQAPGRVFWEEACGRAKEAGQGGQGEVATAGWASATGFRPCFSHPPLRGRQKLAAPTVAASPICSRRIGVGVRSSPRPPAAVAVGVLSPILPCSRAWGSLGGAVWGAQCLGCPLTSLSPAVTRVMGIAHTIHVAVSSQPAPTRQWTLQPSLWGFSDHGAPPPEKVSCCPRNTVILVSQGVT